MENEDSILFQQPFYQWDAPYESVVPQEEPNLGVPLDSLFPFRVADTLMEHPSMFKHHSLVVSHSEAVERPAQGAPVWMFVVLLLFTAAHMYYYRLRRLTLPDVSKALIDVRVLERLVRVNNLTPMRLLLSGVFVAVGVATAVHTEALQDSGLVGWLLLSAALALGYMLRNGLLRLVGSVFGSRQSVEVYINSNYFYHLVLSTAIVPLLFLLVYMPGGGWVAYLIGGLVALMFVARLVRGAGIFFRRAEKTSLFFFYYLCIIEMLPVLVLIKCVFVY